MSALLFKVDELHQFAERAAHTQNSHKITSKGAETKKGRRLTPAHRFENTLVDEAAAVFLIDPCQDVSHVLGSTEIECCSVFLRSPCTLASTSPRFGGSFIRSTHNVKNLVI
nr:MAG TPA: hypothetical protein [Caudoviricetes sp.]